ncbi:alginate export family protein [Acinetobacter baylyi]|uniref:hypothetical protein n=1 Tax=Acinetobacter baylyi TaxID=202950 RepID=UPI000EA21D82|nr:hypothetical protein [Acinetobacter baylyi]
MNRNLYNLAVLVSIFGITSTHADISLYKNDNTSVDANIAAVTGIFYSKKNYIPAQEPSSKSWQEGYLQYGLGITQKLGHLGSLYAKANLVSAETWGDGDAGGYTDGSERATKLEDAYIGWKSGQLLPWLGEDGLEISVGRQSVCLGDGFLICADAPNVGHSPLLGEQFNRHGGGTYYLAGHRDFKDTAVIKIGGKNPLHGSLFTFKSNNAIQAYSRFVGATLDYSRPEKGSLGLTVLHNSSIDQDFASRVSQIMQDRKGMNVYSLRGKSDLGIKNTEFSFEYAVQDKKNGNDASAGYIKAAYTFDTPWKPTTYYRYSRFSEQWDNLFIGAQEYGRWFQGELAYNYSGPFNNNTQISNIGISLTPNDKLTIGALAYDFSDLKNQNKTNYTGRELDLYALWTVTPHMTVSPVIGIYKPKVDLAHGGAQNGDNKTNVYTQLTLSYSF